MEKSLEEKGDVWKPDRTVELAGRCLGVCGTGRERVSAWERVHWRERERESAWECMGESAWKRECMGESVWERVHGRESAWERVEVIKARCDQPASSARVLFVKCENNTIMHLVHLM
jgi:hypothetical protein